MARCRTFTKVGRTQTYNKYDSSKTFTKTARSKTSAVYCDDIVFVQPISYGYGRMIMGETRFGTGYIDG